MPVTIRDVAAASGVAIGTVSRALNGYPDVSDATRERIKQVADELGYAPTKRRSRSPRNACATLASSSRAS